MFKWISEIFISTSLEIKQAFILLIIIFITFKFLFLGVDNNKHFDGNLKIDNQPDLTQVESYLFDTVQSESIIFNFDYDFRFIFNLREKSKSKPPHLASLKRGLFTKRLLFSQHDDLNHEVARVDVRIFHCFTTPASRSSPHTASSGEYLLPNQL